MTDAVPRSDRVGGFRRGPDELVHRGPGVTLVVAEVTAPSGATVRREIVRHPGAVAVVPIMTGPAGPEAVLLRQYRAAIDGLLLEIPAGTRDVDDEDPAATAARELREEAGLAHDHLVHLAGFHNAPGFCDEYLDVYLALDPTVVPDERQGEEELAMTIERVPLADVPAMIADGSLIDAKSIIGLLLALRHLGAP